MPKDSITRINLGDAPRLTETALDDWREEPTPLRCGHIVLGLGGSATIAINLEQWQVGEGTVITFFPNDIVQVLRATPDFRVRALTYSSAILREASLQIENVVYDQLRADRCRTNAAYVRQLAATMMRLLALYRQQMETVFWNDIVLLQLKSFFLGFYDYLQRNPLNDIDRRGSRRMHEIFRHFMILLEENYAARHDVNFYATRLSITPKYLNNIARAITGSSVKDVIDHYIILQLKLLLRTADTSLKEIAEQYQFSSQSFFTRYFRAHTGLTPKEYRLLHKKPAP